MQSTSKRFFMITIIFLTRNINSKMKENANNIEEKNNESIDNELKKINLEKEQINSIAAYTYEMLKTQKKSALSFSSSNMLDDIWNHFDQKKNKRYPKDDQKLKDQNQKNLKNNSDTNMLDNIENIPQFPVDVYPPYNTLVYIAGDSDFDPNQEYEIYNPVQENDQNNEQNNLSFQNNSNKWQMTTKSEMKTSSLAKSSSQILDSSSSSTRSTNKRNYIMGLGNEKKKEEVDLTSLMNHLEQNEGDIDMILPEGLNFKMKDSKGKISVSYTHLTLPTKA